METCTLAPEGWITLGEQRAESLPCCEPLSEAARAEIERERAAERAELDALTEQLSALQARVKQGKARIEQLTHALAGEAVRDVPVEARADHKRGVVVVVRSDTSEVIRERSMTAAELARCTRRTRREAA